MKFADQRKQYKRSQDAFKANEEIIKSIRRELTKHMHAFHPLISELLPRNLGPRQLLIATLDTDPRAAAAYQPFGIRVQGLVSWHEPNEKVVKQIINVMKPEGWKTVGLQHTEGNTHWYIDFT